MTYIIFFITALAFSVLINGLFLKFSGTLGTKNNADKNTVRWASTTKPALGGVSFFIIFILSFAVYASFFSAEKLEGKYLGLMFACVVGFLIGLADDAYNTKPLLKFLGQLACAAILIASGIYIDLFAIDWINYLITTLWVVGMMNSINMLDNMDGITTSISIGAVLLCLMILVHLDFTNHILFWLCLGTLASLIGFLYYNWNPSRMYMGDTGSQFLGVLLSAFGIIFLWNGWGFNDSESIYPRLLSPILAFLPSLVDTTTVTINRLAKGTSPFVGGKDHTTHHLSYAGLSDRQVAMVFLSLAIVSGGICLYVNYYLPTWTTLISVLCTVFALIVFITLFGLTKRKKQKS